MSDTLPSKTERETDLNSRDMEKVVDFQEAGLPGLAALKDTEIAQIMDLYLSGKTYDQISNIMHIKKTLILYLSYKFKWFLMKQEYFCNLEDTIRERTIETKIVSQDFLLQMIQFWHTKIGKKMNKFLKTGDESIAEDIDFKEYDKYLKTIEVLHKVTGEGRATKEGASPVGINVGEGMTIKKLGNNEVEITPKQKSIQEMLRLMAESRREEENKKNSQKHDINVEVAKTGEKQ